MYTAAGWSEYDPIFGRLDALCAASQNTVPDDPNHWAADLIRLSQAWTSEDLSAVGRRILASLPYNALQLQLGSHDGSGASAEDLKRSRKFVLVARDCLTLTTPEIATAPYDPLFEVARELGRLADGEKTDREALHAAVDALATTTFIDTEPVSDATLRETFSTLLGSSIAALTHEPVQDPESYHNHRKTFRRTVHAVMAQAAACPNDATTQLAHSGIALNQRFGAIKDSLMETFEGSGREA